MNNIIESLYMSFSENELIAMIRSFSNNDKISDASFKMYAAALTLSWISFDDLRRIMNEIAEDEGGFE